MPRERVDDAFILKKQSLGEADELITFFTREHGKLRAVAKSSKLSRSKMQPQLQPMFLCRITVAGRGTLSTIIRIQAQRVYASIHSDVYRTALWYVIAELLLKGTPDEQKSEALFELLEETLNFLDTESLSVEQLELGLIKFKIRFSELLGFAIQVPGQTIEPLYFSNHEGGFGVGQPSQDGVTVSEGTRQLFNQITATPFNTVAQLSPKGSSELQHLLSEFIMFHLEREIKSEKFL